MTDEQAVLRCQDGDREAFHHLVERYQDLLYRTAMLMTGSRALAEELVQGALRSAWRGIHGFQHECPVKPWLMRYLAREGVSQRRRRPAAGVVPVRSRTAGRTLTRRSTSARRCARPWPASMRTSGTFWCCTSSRISPSPSWRKHSTLARTPSTPALGRALGQLREGLEAQGAQEVANDGS